MKCSALPSVERVRELFECDLASGLLKWRITKNHLSKAGTIAGCVRADGRRVVRVDGVLHLAYRIIWVYAYGIPPKNGIDHLNGDPTDNRIENLRDVPQEINSHNHHRAHIDKKTGLLAGAYLMPSKRWMAHIGVKGKIVYLGRFDTEVLAHTAYINAKRELHQGCTV